MLLGALFDLGVDFAAWQEEIRKLGLEEGPGCESAQVRRRGIAGRSFRVVETGGGPARRLEDIRRIVGGSALEAGIKEKTLAAFERLAECEGAVHGRPPAEIHFHELSGLDTIVDIAGAFIALDMLGAVTVYSSPVNVGAGFVEMSHGTLPVPAPATARLLEGAAVYSRFDGELTTPTGALLITQLAAGFGPMPEMTLRRVGCGAGGTDFPHPNILRAFLGRPSSGGESPGGPAASGEIFHLSTNIDDMDPRICGYVCERLLDMGALDVYTEPVYMKKNRPGFVLNVLCGPEMMSRAIEFIIRETTTLGVRYRRVRRVCADRRIETVETEYGPLRVKLGYMSGGLVNANPEYEDCAAAARSSGAPLADVMEAARRAAADMFGGTEGGGGR